MPFLVRPNLQGTILAMQFPLCLLVRRMWGLGLTPASAVNLSVRSLQWAVPALPVTARVCQSSAPVLTAAGPPSAPPLCLLHLSASCPTGGSWSLRPWGAGDSTHLQPPKPWDGRWPWTQEQRQFRTGGWMCHRVSMWHSGWRVGSGSRCQARVGGCHSPSE